MKTKKLSISINIKEYPETKRRKAKFKTTQKMEISKDKYSWVILKDSLPLLKDHRQ